MCAWLLERWLESFTDKSLILLNPSLEANGDSFHLSGFFCDLWPKASVRSHLPGWVVLYRRAAPRWRLYVCALMHKIMWIKLEKCGSLSRAVEPIFNNPQCTFFFIDFSISSFEIRSCSPFFYLSAWRPPSDTPPPLSLWSTENHPPGAAALVGEPVASPPLRFLMCSLKSSIKVQVFPYFLDSEAQKWHKTFIYRCFWFWHIESK